MRTIIALIIATVGLTALAEQPFVAIEIKSSLKAINNYGQAVGNITNSDGTRSAIMFDGSTHTIAAGTGSVSATAINDAGAIAYYPSGGGYAIYDSATNTSTYLWQYLNYWITQDIKALNNNGMMCGNHYYQRDGGRERYGITLTLSDPTIVKLPNYHLYLDIDDDRPMGSYAWDLNDAGVVVGSSTWWPGDPNPYQEVASYWTGTTIHKLGTLGYSASTAFAINTNGDIAGALYNTGVTRGFLYTNGTMHELSNFTEAPVAMNDSGTIIGATKFYDNGAVGNFLDLMPPGWSNINATDINNSNQVCGYATGPDGLTHGFILQVPEPATLSLLAAGMLLGLRRRRS